MKHYQHNYNKLNSLLISIIIIKLLTLNINFILWNQATKEFNVTF